MQFVRGNLRVADIYFTEFNRLFNHYYFRSVTEATAHGRELGSPPLPPPADHSLTLLADDSLLVASSPGKLCLKRVQVCVWTGGIES